MQWVWFAATYSRFTLETAPAKDGIMQFRIADTFTASLARLTNDEQKSVKTTAFDLQIDPTGAGMSFHKLDRAKDKNFCKSRCLIHRRKKLSRSVRG